MYIMKTSKEFAALGLTVNEVIKSLNKYFDGASIDNVRFYSAEMDYTCSYSPKCCLSAAILWLHEQGIEYFYGMPLPCEEKKGPIQGAKVLSASVSIEADSFPELDVKMTLCGNGGFNNVLVDSICEDLIHYTLKYGEDKQKEDEDEENNLYEHELELLDLKKKIVWALGISLSDRKIAIDDISKLHDFSYLIKLIECQTHSYENTSTLLNKANTRCTELETLKEDICKIMTIPSNTADINVVREVGGLKRKLMDAKEDLDKLNEKYYDLQHRYDITHDAFVERNAFRDEVYKILNVNKATWSDPDIYSTLKIQQERADLYTRRENLEEKVPFMIEELYDLIRTPYSDERLNQDTEDPCYMGIVTQQMFDYLKERIESFKEKAEDEQQELKDQYNNLRTDLINVLGVDRDSDDRQLLCKVSRLYYFRREVQRKLDCPNYSDENTMAVLLKTIDKAKCFDDMDKQYTETTKSLCEIAAIIERLQSTDEKKDT